jgi:hypothetical protein
VAGLVGHPHGEEAGVVVVGREGQQGPDAQAGDVGLDPLRVADGVAEPRGQGGRTADAPDRSIDGVEVERPLGLERACGVRSRRCVRRRGREIGAQGDASGVVGVPLIRGRDAAQMRNPDREFPLRTTGRPSL